ncbi:hypothetical protein B0O80DRAFT_524313 [Mortierella sp. GBAus27b]|nr:hypothetical protein B0O80DRAFT_524313 [Mortierella sp. GBAus27b]
MTVHTHTHKDMELSTPKHDLEIRTTFLPHPRLETPVLAPDTRRSWPGGHHSTRCCFPTQSGAENLCGIPNFHGFIPQGSLQGSRRDRLPPGTTRRPRHVFESHSLVLQGSTYLERSDLRYEIQPAALMGRHSRGTCVGWHPSCNETQHLGYPEWSA